MKLKLPLIASAAYLASALSASAVNVFSDTSGVPVGSPLGSEKKTNPISPELKTSEIINEQSNAVVMTPEVPPSPPAKLVPIPQ